MWMSVELLAVFGFTLMKRLATWPPSKTQSTVSPAKTLATFSSAGRRIRVDCRRPVRTTGGVSASDTEMVRGALGARCFASEGDANASEAERARPKTKRTGTDGFMK